MKLLASWEKFLNYLSHFNDNTLEEHNFTSQEQLIIGSAILMIPAGLIWGILYFLLNEVVSGWIPFSYGITLSVMLGIYLRTRNTEFFVSTHHLLTLLLPFFLQVSLGGFVNSSAVILWSFISPLSAMVVNKQRVAIRWFMGFIAIICIGGLIDPFLSRVTNLSPAAILILFVMNLVAVLGINFVLMQYFVREKDDAFKLLTQEQQKSENLLLNVLPSKIAATLKNKNQLIAEQFDNASILFADLVGFTRLSSEISPREMVEMLNEIYSCLDGFAEKYGLEKIRTIGDGYMVASGVPTPRPDHAQAISLMALDIIDYTKTLQPLAGQALQFRVGINSGPLVAGVVGRTKFHYDVWGDMVNVASRMESHGIPGKIQISDYTCQLIQEQFICEQRGMIEVKGKGEMLTWFLLGKKPG